MATDIRHNLPPQVTQALQRGNVIEAIKLLRQHMPQLGLAEAKAMLDALQKEAVKVQAQAKAQTAAQHAQHNPHVSRPHAPAHTPIVPPSPSDLSPGEMPRTSSGAVFAGIFVAIVVVLAAAVYFGR
jgi:hypothetical protein